MENVGELRDLHVRRVTNAESKLSKRGDWNWSGVKHKAGAGIIKKAENTLKVNKSYL